MIFTTAGRNLMEKKGGEEWGKDEEEIKRQMEKDRERRWTEKERIRTIFEKKSKK